MNKLKEEESVVQTYETSITIMRDILRLEGIEKVSDIEIVKTFEDEMISQGKIPAKFLRILNNIIKAKKDYDDKKLTKEEVEGVRKAFVASGVRYHLITEDKKHGYQYLKEMVKYHISGQMKVAPEHTEQHVLDLMGKPGKQTLVDFKKLYVVINRADPDMAEGIKKDLEKSGIEVLGAIPEDRNILEFDYAGRPLPELPADSPALLEIMRIKDRLTGAS